jgi:acyl-CoA thioesterase-1
MTTLTYILASGAGFFAGAAFIVIAVLVDLFPLKHTGTAAMRIVAIAGVALVVASATPLPWWVYGLWAGMVLAWLIGGRLAASIRGRRRRLGRVLNLLAAGVTFVAIAIEAPWHARPEPPQETWRRLVVIGDSLSTSLRGETPWPEVIAREHNINVTNLAQAGATAFSANVQARAVPPGRALVIVEIGGNDLLGGTPADVFEASLDSLLRTVRHRQRRIVMLELPLPPLKNRYGLVQRRLARKYNAILIPKRYLAMLLADGENTLDGLHLSDRGHDRMAALLWNLAARTVRPRLRPPVEMAMKKM